MKFIKLTAISAAVLASTAALAADPVIVVDDNAAVAYEVEPVAVAYQAEPASYAYDANAGVVSNTTGAVVGGTKGFFSKVVNPASVSAEVGTLGYGANIGWSMNEKTELQAGWAGGDVADLFGGDFDADDVNYDVDADFSNPYLGVQLRPTGNWFTVGAGIIVPDNDFDVTANSEGGTYKINDVSYNADDVGTLQGTMEHRNKLAPYATIGFRPNITNNFGLFGEIGAAYMGKTDATVNATDPEDVVRVSNGVTDIPSGLNAGQVAKLAEQELEDKDWLEWLPIVKVGATYRF
ncbi:MULTISPECIES: hypothetical protein [unclassified Psychrobacter]|uniref:hypothetical protein n=1 Tax=unclassified Psychrobacter TaxID=196806 RepID=UPI00086A6C29|nr:MULTISPECIES: hypothetical protein [unclassified Psychrobacter]OEH68659.1 MAG: hypothetical protein BAX61_00095 [Psychrobacter sp. B29-1]TEW86028.1 hypothetical protein E2545_07910 [Psychrobacter sp. 230]|tara:strand:+ start:130429 stop:131307 length:879 start_codon:yes stop_codon:yes gene_type:complete